MSSVHIKIKYIFLIALLAGGCLFSGTHALAEPNPTINYQGKLTGATGVAVPNGTYNMRFYLYDDPAVPTTSAIWTETLTGSNKVTVTNGLFSVMLGSTTSFASQGVDFNQTLYLGVEIGGADTPAWDGEMSPRKVLGTVPASFVANRALDSALLGGVASTSFLRSDQADTASSLLTFSGGLLSTASSTITNLNFSVATGTTLIINGETITDFTGAGLALNGTTLTVATSTLNLAIADTTGTLAVSRGGTGATTLTGILKGNGTDAFTAITGTTGYNTYWSDANTLASEQYTALARGGTNADLSGVATGGLIYKGASALASTGALTGVLKGNGASAPSAMTGTTSFVTRWTDANTLGTGVLYDDGTNVGIGTTSPSSKLSLQLDSFSGNGTAGISNYITTTNSVNGALQFGDYSFLTASNTATTTIVGKMLRIADDTLFGNVVRGLEVQSNRGINTLGENTAISGTGRTFGVRGITSADAGGVYEPAGGYFETRGTASGNAIRAYSNTITTASLLNVFHASSSFTGTGLEMNFGNAGGSFSASSSKYLDFRNSNDSVFVVSAYGTTTIGNGVQQAGLQIMNGGLCVDTNGCSASTSGRISAVEYHTGNSDLAETYFSATSLEPGEVVSLAGGLSVNRANNNDTVPVLGVVSTKPGLLLGYDDSSLNESETAYPIALSGRVPVKLSTENGEIKIGDPLMLSSLPGVAMKATGTGQVIGIALEAFDDTRKYSDTFINQFGDDMVDPVFEKITSNDDSRLHDGCYYSGGTDIGTKTCVPLKATTTIGRITEANELIEQETVAEALANLASEESEKITIRDGLEVKVGRIVMFVEREKRWLDEKVLLALNELTGTTSLLTVGEKQSETLFDRLVMLANSFIDGVLSIFELKANRIEVVEELCIDGVCVRADDLRHLLNGHLESTGKETSPVVGADDLAESPTAIGPNETKTDDNYEPSDFSGSDQPEPESGTVGTESLVIESNEDSDADTGNNKVGGASDGGTLPDGDGENESDTDRSGGTELTELVDKTVTTGPKTE